MGIILRAPALVDQFDRLITTNTNPNQLVDLACIVDKAEENKVNYYENKGLVTVSQSGNFGQIPNIEAFKKFIKD